LLCRIHHRAGYLGPDRLARNDGLARTVLCIMVRRKTLDTDRLGLAPAG
jgi:hypothetical protein